MKSKTRPYAQGARALATEATARRIVEAFLARLLEQWFDEITLDRVAEDAGVTVQTVVRRFGGKEGLLGEAVKLLATQVEAKRAAPTPGQMAESVVEDYERTGDAVLRLLALEPRHPALGEFLDFGRASHRAWVSRTFGGKLAGQALDALVVLTDVYTWKLLRRDMKRSRKDTAETMNFLIRATLAELNIKEAL